MNFYRHQRTSDLVKCRAWRLCWHGRCCLTWTHWVVVFVSTGPDMWNPFFCAWASLLFRAWHATLSEQMRFSDFFNSACSSSFSQLHIGVCVHPTSPVAREWPCSTKVGDISSLQESGPAMALHAPKNYIACGNILRPSLLSTSWLSSLVSCLKLCSAPTWGLPKIRGNFFGVFIIRIGAFWGLHWGPPVLGNYHSMLTTPQPGLCG